MLKIKDNVDLKELEKFGFKFDDKIGRWLCLDKKSLIKAYVKINSWNGKIQICTPLDCDQLVPDVLFDLIKSDLVEKI